MLGHRKILTGLQETIKKDNVAHAYIFEGPDGIGRRETALSFTAMLMCESELAPCGTCKSCQLLAEGSHPDFLEIYSQEKSISVDEVRNILKGLVIRPLYSRYKVIIINDADSMTVQAQNALLKSLEEPPPYVIFILTVESAAAVTPTVKSRCQRVLFDKLGSEEIYGILEGKHGPRKPEWDFIVSYSDGVVGTALELVEAPGFMELRNEVLHAVNDLLKVNSDVFKIYDLFEKNNDRVDFILRIMLMYFRDILIYNQTSNYNILINSDKKDMIIGNADLKLSSLFKCINAVWSAKRGLEYNANFQLAIEVMLMKIKESYVYL